MWESFWAWAWARHHNVLSWYIRPLFLVPYIWFAYRRSRAGIGVTVVLLLSSMFWFPAPAHPDPAVEDFLSAERDYLTSGWGLTKLAWTATIPLFFWLLGRAFWRRSWRWGIVVMAAAAIGKVGWSLGQGGASGKTVAAPAALGLLVCLMAVALGVRLHRRQGEHRAE